MKVLSLIAIAIALSSVAACTKQQPSSEANAATAAVSQAPAVPGWTVETDANFKGTELQRISEKLGTSLVALRNTTYSVQGHKVKINTMTARDAAAADKLEQSLKQIKPEQFLLRKGTTVYEFVCKNDAIPLVKTARAHLDR